MCCWGVVRTNVLRWVRGNTRGRNRQLIYFFTGIISHNIVDHIIGLDSN